MLRIESILCLLDSYEYSLKACEYALSLAPRDGAMLFLQHLGQPLTLPVPATLFRTPSTKFSGTLKPAPARNFLT